MRPTEKSNLHCRGLWSADCVPPYWGKRFSWNLCSRPRLISRFERKSILRITVRMLGNEKKKVLEKNHAGWQPHLYPETRSIFIEFGRSSWWRKKMCCVFVLVGSEGSNSERAEFRLFIQLITVAHNSLPFRRLQCCVSSPTRETAIIVVEVMPESLYRRISQILGTRFPLWVTLDRQRRVRLSWKISYTKNSLQPQKDELHAFSCRPDAWYASFCCSSVHYSALNGCLKMGQLIQTRCRAHVTNGQSAYIAMTSITRTYNDHAVGCVTS